MDIPAVLAERYITENVQPYLSAPVPIDPTFVNDVEWLLAGWVVGKGLDAALAYLNKRLGSPAYRARAKRAGLSVQLMEGEGPDISAVQIGRLRPFIRVNPGRLLVVRKLSILYEGSRGGIFEALESPGVILSDVEIVREGTSRARQIAAAAKAAEGLFDRMKATVVVPSVRGSVATPPIRLVAGSTKYKTWWPRGSARPPPR